MDKGLSPIIYAVDMTTLRAVVNVADLIKQRGVRTLNILVDGAVKVVPLDQPGCWCR